MKNLAKSVVNFLANEDVAWGRACIWPGDRKRLDAFDAAVRQRRLLGNEVQLSRVNAGVVPGRLPALAKVSRDRALVFR